MQERANQPKQKIEYNFDVTKHIRLVSPFQEKEVDKYFLLFEKVAKKLKLAKRALDLSSVYMGILGQAFPPIFPHFSKLGPLFKKP